MADSRLTFDILARDRASDTFKKVGRSAEDSHKRLSDLTGGLGDLGSRMSKVMTIAGAVGPGIVAVGAAMSSAAAGGVAIAGALGPAAAAGLAAYGGALLAVKSASLVTSFALDGVADAAGGDAKAMAALSPAGQSFARTLAGLKPRLDAVRTAVQNGLFPGVENATNRLATAYFPLLQTAAHQTGSALGDLAVDGSKMAASGPWRKDFGTVAKANAGNIRLMGNAGLSLADAARSLIVTSMPVTRMFLSWATGAAAAVDRFVQVKRESGALDAFWSKAASSGATLGHILGNLAVGLFNVFKIGAGGQGTSMLKTLEDITGQFRAWTSSSSGVSKISGWFAEGRKNLDAMGRLIGSVSSGLAGMGSGKQLAPLIDQIRTKVIPPLMEFLRNASASGALNSLVDAVGKVVQVFADLSKHDGSLKAFAKTLGVLADSAGWIVRNVPGAGAALAGFFAVAGASNALKFVGLSGVVDAVGGSLSGLATKFLTAAGAADAETGSITANSIVTNISKSTLGTWLGVKALELGAWVRSAAASAASTAGVVANAVATRAAAAGAKVMAAAQWLLNAALDANPIGIVVVAIAALAAGLVYAYKHSETFRNIVNAGFKAVGAAARWLWNNAIQPAMVGIGKALGVVMTIWSKMLGAVGHVPGFGWAKTASAVMGAAADKALHLGDTLNKIPDNTKANVNAHVVGQAALDAIKRTISTIHDKTVTVTSQTRTTGSGAYTKTARAGGGNVQTGHVYKINEIGPEYFIPSTNGRVVPAGNGGGQGSGGSETTIVINVNGALDPTATAKQIQQMLLRLKRTNGGSALGIA